MCVRRNGYSMTVGELVQELLKHPLDMPVLTVGQNRQESWSEMTPGGLTTMERAITGVVDLETKVHLCLEDLL